MRVILVGSAKGFFRRPETTDAGAIAAMAAIEGIRADEIRLKFPEGSRRPRYFTIKISGHVVRLGARQTEDAVEVARVAVSKQ